MVEFYFNPADVKNLDANELVRFFGEDELRERFDEAWARRSVNGSGPDQPAASTSSAKHEREEQGASHTAGGDEEQNAADFSNIPLTIADWMALEIEPLDPLLGELLTTTTRGLLAAPTGLGKTNIVVQLAMHMAAGKAFLHWDCPRPARVLYIDGEMSRRRLKSASERCGKPTWSPPATFFASSHETIDKFAPLNTKQGQQCVERLIGKIGGVDFVFLDSVMCLTVGDMKDEESLAADVAMGEVADKAKHRPAMGAPYWTR